MRIVNGAYRGADAILLELDEKRFCCKLKIDQGLLKGRIIDGVSYEDLCKIHVAS